MSVNRADTLHQQMMSESKDSRWSDSFLILHALVSHAMYLEHTGRMNEAEVLYLRMLEGFRNTVGESHQTYISVLGNYRAMLDHVGGNKGKSRGT